MNNKHLSWYKEINNNFIIASRAYFLQSPTCTRVNNLDYTVMILTPMEPWCWSCFAHERGLVNGSVMFKSVCILQISMSPTCTRVNNLDYTVMILTPMEPWCWSCFARGRGLVNESAKFWSVCILHISMSPTWTKSRMELKRLLMCLVLLWAAPKGPYEPGQ